MPQLGVMSIPDGSTKDWHGQSVVYFIRRDDTGLIKIGCSQSPRSRWGEIARKAGGRVTCLGVIPGDRKIEAKLHEQFAAYHVGHEWHEPSQALLDFIENSTYAVSIRAREVKGEWCQANTRGGYPCNMPARPNGYCYIHQPAIAP